MADHDPLCTYGPEFDRMAEYGACSECDLIARVRADFGDCVAALEVAIRQRNVAMAVEERLRPQVAANRAEALLAADERDAARAEVEVLARWKNEATEVLAGWERVYEALGSPGRLGESKSAAALAYVKSWQGILEAAKVSDAARREALTDLRAQIAADIEALRDGPHDLSRFGWADGMTDAARIAREWTP